MKKENEKRKGNYKHEEYKDYKIVALKTLSNSQNLNQNFLQELTFYKMFRSSVVNMVSCYGISKDVKGNCIMVMEYMSEGNLREYLKKNYQDENLENRLHFLKRIALGLKNVHHKKLIHRDFHSGNILVEKYGICCITDLGLSRPVNEEEKEGMIYGLMPYVAPEVLRGQLYTQKADIYSLGMIMYEILSGYPPFYSEEHDINLALAICQGIRPQFPNQVKYPQLLVDLIEKCWDQEPNKRPTAREISGIVEKWFEQGWSLELKKDIEFYHQYKEAKKCNQSLPKEIKYPNYQTKEIWHSKSINTNEINKLLNDLNLSEEIIIQKSKEVFLKESEEIAPIEISSPQVNWTDIHPSFTNELIKKWQERGFTSQQTQEWINIGLQPTDYNFCAWLRDNKHLTPEQVLNKGNLEQLNQEFLQEQQQTNIEVPPK